MSFIISAPFLMHSLATFDLKVSIEILRFGVIFLTISIVGINLSNSVFSETGIEPGLDDEAPISIIFAPSCSIFLICFSILSFVINFPPS